LISLLKRYKDPQYLSGSGGFRQEDDQYFGERRGSWS